MKKGFTLIELLIVVAIIAILAAIAVPNFLEAQTRAKISRVRADFRSLATALEAYNVDEKHYPPSYATGHVVGTRVFDMSLYCLTTPVAYMSSITIRDPFNETELISQANQTRPLLMYFNYEVLKPGPALGGPYLGASAPGPMWQKEDWASAAMGHFGGLAAVSLQSHRAFVLWSPGPDKHDNETYWVDYNPQDRSVLLRIYDPTNGSVSRGDILRLGGEIRANWLPVDGVR